MNDVETASSILSSEQREMVLTRRGDKKDFWPLVRAGLFTYEPIYHSIDGYSRQVGYKADYTPLGHAVRCHLEAAA